jgi:hypothetical protein
MLPYIAIAISGSLFSQSNTGGILPGTVLETPSFHITISETCPEYAVDGCTATYVGINKKSGASISLKGAAVMAMCNDNVTPCHFQYYKFINGAYSYFIFLGGEIRVSKAHTNIFHEQSTWHE